MPIPLDRGPCPPASGTPGGCSFLHSLSRLLLYCPSCCFTRCSISIYFGYLSTGVDTALPKDPSKANATKKAIKTVIKFGGSSLATAERLKEVAALVKFLVEEGQTPIMVCSAMGKTTNNLLNAGDFALKDGKVGRMFLLYTYVYSA